jgi:hypothetical protein
MAAASSDAASVAEAQAETAEQPTEAANPTPEKSPYDDLLCTICNLKACWMTPEAAGKTGAR